ncbi:MAG TPA: GntR family transcriptional regulator [Candidatus Polarisedimenticolia bacterium]|nr:GntR family transcriptional regulator [Candidatus Polarisedimenticolia bacterium]
MKFEIESHSPTSFRAQIKERVKIALALGELRPGDTLPSIRDLEQELGIGRAIIRRAYLELEESGMLEIRPGRRITVNGSLMLRTDKALVKRLESLVTKTLKQVRQLNVAGSSFGKLLLARSLDQDRKKLSYLLVDPSEILAQKIAKQISQLWEVPIHAASIDALPALLKSQDYQVHKIIVPYYQYDEVREMAEISRRREHVEVVPVSLKFTKDMFKQMRTLPRGSTVLFATTDHDFKLRGQTFAHAFHEAFQAFPVRFLVRPMRTVESIMEWARSEEYSLILVGNSIWDTLPADIRGLKILSHPRVEVDRSLLEQARLGAGIII